MSKTSPSPPSLSSPPSPAVKLKVLIDPSVRCCNCQHWTAVDGAAHGLCGNLDPLMLKKVISKKLTHRGFGCINFAAMPVVVQAKREVQ